MTVLSEQVVRVLHVEDSLPDAGMVREVLEAWDTGVKISLTRTQEAFESAVNSGGFDAVLCDYHLTGFDGLKALERVRRSYPEVPFIIVSGRIADDSAVDALKRGATDYVSKERLNKLPSALSRALKEVEERRLRRETQRCLTESERQYRSIVAAIPDVLWTADKDRNFVFVAPNASRVTGFSLEEIDRMGGGGWGARIDPADQAAVWTAYQGLFADGIGYDLEYRFQRKDGSWIRLHDRAVSVVERDGMLQATGLFSNVTERARLETQLRQAQKMESIGQLAAGIAHEINTPVQYIGDNIRFLDEATRDLARALEAYEQFRAGRREGAPDAESGAVLDAVLKEVDLGYLRKEVPSAVKQSLEGMERVSNILRAMKEFSHPGVERKTFVDLNRGIETTATVARNEWKYVADLELDFEAGLPQVPCLPGEINQVFLNLIVNAAHAIADANREKEGARGKIVIRTRRAGESVEVRIEDTGRGIPEEVKSRIFEPFFTTKEVGKGTGQGLALAHSVIVGRHGGELTFDSRVGRGTTFRVVLPLVSGGEIPS